MKAIQVLQKTVHEKNMTEVRREIQTKIKAYMRKGTKRRRQKIAITLGKEQNVCLNVNNNNNVTS